MQQYFTQNDATRDTPEAFAERHENVTRRDLTLPPMTKNQVMDLAMDLGKILLKSGAETSRVEDTMMLLKMLSMYCAMRIQL